MKTLSTPYYAETIVNRSKFLTSLVPYSDFEGLQEKLKKEHPKANHAMSCVERSLSMLPY